MYDKKEDRKSFFEILGTIFGSIGSFLFSSIEAIVVALSISVVLYLFFMTPHEVVGSSMFPTYQNGQHLIANKVVYKVAHPKRGDVVIFKYSEREDFIKRIIALPGEKISIKDGRYYINGMLLNEGQYLEPTVYTSGGDYLKEGEEISVPDGQYFVSGDNRPHSSDSRSFGPIQENAVKGRVWLVYYPFEDLKFIRNSLQYQGL